MQQIILDFEAFIDKNGKYYRQFYVGITNDLNNRLVNGHNVDDTVPCIWSTNPLHTNIIRAIEKYFLDKGTKGGPGGGDESAQYVYAYLITPKTRE